MVCFYTCATGKKSIKGNEGEFSATKLAGMAVYNAARVGKNTRIYIGDQMEIVSETITVFSDLSL